MNLVACLVPQYARRPMIRTMSSLARLAPGSTLVGSRWDYRIVREVKGDSTHRSAVFIAEVLAHSDVLDSPKWAMIKTAPAEDAVAKENLRRELASYHLPEVSSAPCFRRLYDEIDNCTLAGEWLETTLAEMEYRPDACTYALIQLSLDAALTSCVVLDNQNYVNTDYKPANILLSGVKTDQITAKVGDLGLVFPAGDRFNAQPFAMRAPEVFLGQACIGPSQVWAVAAMLLCWIRPNVLGNADSPYYLVDAAWCMAKIKRLFPDWKLPDSQDVDGPVLKAAVQAAKRMSQEEALMQTILPVQEEMQKVEMPQQLRNLLNFILVPNPNERPSAFAVLASKEYQAFKEVVST